MDLAQCQPTNSDSKPLDGISQAHTLFKLDPDQNLYSNRNEILHFMDPLAISEETDPRGDWKGKGQILENRCFSIQEKDFHFLI